MFELELGSLTTSCFLGLAAILLFYRFSVRNHDYWKKRGIPFDKPIPLFGSIRQVFNKPAHEIEKDRYDKYGSIYGYYEGSNANLTVGDPELIRDILVKDFSTFHTRRVIASGNEIFDKMLSVMKGDEDWKRIRSIITPTFTTGKIKRMMSILNYCSSTLVKNFRDASTKGKSIDAKRLYGAFTMDVIASSAFSTKIDSHNDPDNQFVKFASKVFLQKINWRMFIFIVFPSLMKLFKVDFFPPDVINFFKKITYEIMEERKSTGQTRNDFLQLLMNTAKEVADDQNVDPSEKNDIASNYGVQEDINPQILKSVSSKNLSMNELVSTCVIFFIGGYDTTASTLSFATYFLALHPDIQDRVRAEVDEAIKQSNGELTYEATQSMKYLDNVISETLRLYPPLIKTDRTADAEYKLGDTGITLSKGMIASIPIYALHRDSELFPEPETFNPDRFNPEERAKLHPYTYLPFGAGPRNCVAMRFALMEVKVCLAHVIANFHVKRCPETKVPLEFDKGQMILQPKGILLEMETRNDSPLLA